MLAAGKIRLVCLLAGLLTIGEMGLQATATEAVPETKQDVYTEDAEAGSMESLLEETCEHLALEEAALKERLEEKEALLEPGDEEGQRETEELKEHIRTVQLRQMVLEARMEEVFSIKE